MDEKEIEIKVKEIFEQEFPEIDDKEFNFDKKHDQFENWDSVSHLVLVSKIEEKFKISLEMNEVVELDTPQKFVDLVKQKTHTK